MSGKSITHHKVVAIVQARMGSTRLPRKVMKKIMGRSMLWHIVNRIEKSRFIDDIIIIILPLGNKIISRKCNYF